ncbi:hypothetical protein [Nocardia sputi]|uniref:hypothetical protein n=1 Tax=Nocardia sputi TaxID=2943705 RepID=UPI0020BDB815|nr:hypothetical protein [Nocardia sputi]
MRGQPHAGVDTVDLARDPKAGGDPTQYVPGFGAAAAGHGVDRPPGAGGRGVAAVDPRHTHGARYFRAGTAEQAGVIETVFE